MYIFLIDKAGYV